MIDNVPFAVRENTPRSIATAGGHYVDIFLPKAEQIYRGDICHALGNICRFGGHSAEFYSVAQHSIYVADHLRGEGESVETVIGGLFHDCAEAFMGDIPRPIKYNLPDWRDLEDLLMREAFKSLELNWELINWEAIKKADRSVLKAEAFVLMRNSKPETWGWGETRMSSHTSSIFLDVRDCWMPPQARILFKSKVGFYLS